MKQVNCQAIGSFVVVSSNTNFILKNKNILMTLQQIFFDDP